MFDGAGRELDERFSEDNFTLSSNSIIFSDSVTKTIFRVRLSFLTDSQDNNIVNNLSNIGKVLQFLSNIKFHERSNWRL